LGKKIILLLPFFLIIGFKIYYQINTSLENFTDYPKVKAYKTKKKKNASVFQGNQKIKNILGVGILKWYSKKKSILMVFPGILISNDGSTKHIFIQIINGKTAEREYINFPIEDFYNFIT
jgi:hypothetical protein